MLAVLFGGTLLVHRSFDVEAEDGNFDAVRRSANGAPSLFLGKSLGICLQVVVLELVLVPGIALLYNVRIENWVLLLSAAVGGTLAFSVCGVLWGAMAAGLRVRATLLPLLLVPVLAPILLAGSRAFETALGAVPYTHLTLPTQEIGEYSV